MKNLSLFNRTRVLCTTSITALFAIVLLSIMPANAAIVTDIHEAPMVDRFAALPFFDPTLGSLNRVQMGFSFEVPVTLTFSNSSSSVQHVSLSNHTLKATVSHPNTFPSVLTLQEHVLSESYEIPAGSPPRRVCLPFGGGCFTTPGSPGTRLPVTNTYSFAGGLDSRPRIIDPIGLPPFPDPDFPGFSVSPFEWNGSGSGNFGVTADGFLDPPFLPTLGTSIFPTIGSATNGSVSVIYTYEAALAVVPVPSATWLFLTGLIGLGLIARRQNRAA